MPVKVRFAPSPTGKLHVGNARVAVLNWLFARARGGAFVLRLDDTDAERSTEAFARGIEADLAWLGLDWDDVARQSARLARYDAAMERLKRAGRLYPCFETAEELELKRRVRLGQGRPPIYDRAALALSADEQAALVAAGRAPHWRFKLSDAPVGWEDLARGPVRFEAGHLSDPVLVRADGRPLYTLSSVVDDGEMAITHVLRGEDHVANTAVQVELFQALGFEVPDFAHLPLLVGADGKALSKRIGGLSLDAMRADGIEPRALMAYLARLGTPRAADGSETPGRLAGELDLGAFGRASPRFDPDELAALNAKVLHRLDFEAVKERLAGLGLARADAAFWETVRPNLTRFDEVVRWWAVARGEVDPRADAEDRAFLSQAADALAEMPWGADVWARWTAGLKQRTGRKGKALFLPLRRALTGADHGPELAPLLTLMGRERALARLARAAGKA